MPYTIATMATADWPQVQSIYRQGIATGNATFRTEPPDWKKWDTLFRSDCRLVAKLDQTVYGWAAVSAVSSRHVYGGVAETSIYVATGHQRKAVGLTLLKALIPLSEQTGIWTLQAGIFPENRASLNLHRRCGFREVGTRQRLGKMTYGPWAGRWRDVILMERRSAVSGLA